MFYSPLRYPGGKGKLAGFMELVIDESNHRGGTYIEPFAGGAGIALQLLEKDVVSEIVINDYDKRIYSFWKAVLTETDRFIDSIKKTPITIDEWNKQRAVCMNRDKQYSFELGFATFFLNRTNRSGIIKGGVIGGKDQNGDWKLDARYNKDSLIKRIVEIAKYKTSIHFYNKDIESFIVNYLPKYEKNAIVYFDPPYFNKGKQLYMNYFCYEDHERIERLIGSHVNCDWVITYDDAPEIAKIYKDYDLYHYELNYSLSKKRKANELIIFKNQEMIPDILELKKRNIRIDLK